MTPVSGRTRSAVFFMGDAYSAAESAALALGDHGLSDAEVEELAQQIVALMADFVASKEVGP
jgi:hypothetical protein